MPRLTLLILILFGLGCTTKRHEISSQKDTIEHSIQKGESVGQLSGSVCYEMLKKLIMTSNFLAVSEGIDSTFFYKQYDKLQLSMQFDDSERCIVQVALKDKKKSTGIYTVAWIAIDSAKNLMGALKGEENIFTILKYDKLLLDTIVHQCINWNYKNDRSFYSILTPED